MIFPPSYTSKLDLRQTQEAIKLLKDFFERILAQRLNLTRVSAPLFVPHNSGLQDNLTGVERPIIFDVPAINAQCEIIHSLAKWKRKALKEYNFRVGEGLYTDMNAIRRDEALDNLHSVYVDQWDWERIIRPEDRNLEFLYSIVEIYDCLKEAERRSTSLSNLGVELPESISFITSQSWDLYHLEPKQREDAIAKSGKRSFWRRSGNWLPESGTTDGRRIMTIGASTAIYWSGTRFCSRLWNCRRWVSGRPGGDAKRLKIAGTSIGRNMRFHRELLEGNCLNDRRRDRAVAPVHVFPGKSPHRRSAGGGMAEADHRNVQGKQHLFTITR